MKVQWAEGKARQEYQGLVFLTRIGQLPARKRKAIAYASRDDSPHVRQRNPLVVCWPCSGAELARGGQIQPDGSATHRVGRPGEGQDRQAGGEPLDRKSTRLTSS